MKRVFSNSIRAVVVPIVTCMGMAGCRPAPIPAPAAPPADAAPSFPAPAADDGRPVDICMLRDGEIASAPATYRPSMGDTVVDGRPWREVYTADAPGYAAGTSWYANDQPLPIPRRPDLMKYGPMVQLGAADLRPYGTHEGVALFVEREARDGPPDVVLAFVRPGCEFQPYLQTYTIGAVRG